MKSRTYSLSFMILLLGVIAALNFVSSMVFFRVDFSPRSMYTATRATKKVLSRLEDNLIIRVYFSANLPNPYGANGRYLRDFLEEYKSLSKGRIKLSFIDPARDDKTRRDANMAGIMPIRFTSVEKDKLEMKEGYMGLMMLYGDKNEVIPFVRDTNGLEYEITSRIKKLIDPTKKTIGFSSGHGESTPLEIPEFSRYIDEKYNTRSLDLAAASASIPEDIDCLAVTGPKMKFSDRGLYLVDQFLMKGKPVALFNDEYDVSLENWMARKKESGLADLISHYGVTQKPGLVLDYQCQRISIQGRQGFFLIQNFVDFPFVPVATTFSPDNAITKSFEKLAVPFASALESNTSTAAASRQFTPLVYSSAKSWIMPDLYSLNPMQEYAPSKDGFTGPFVLSAVVEGAFESFFKGKEIPKEKTEKVMAGAAAPPQKIDSVEKSRLFVSGTSAIIRQEFLSDPSCVNYFMNILDWLAEDYDLLSIRAKGFSFRPLDKVSDMKRYLFKYSNMILLPFLVALFGIFRWRTRKVMLERKASEISSE